MTCDNDCKCSASICEGDRAWIVIVDGIPARQLYLDQDAAHRAALLWGDKRTVRVTWVEVVG